MSDPRVFTNRARAESFGAVAAAYDRLRPRYPDALFDDITAELPAGAAALDVGCGTGIAARALAARGLTVLGLEVDPRMAEIARMSGLEVEVAPFERWNPAGRRFDLVTSGQAWHWIDPAVGPALAASVLRPDRVLALFWNYGRLAEPLGAAVERVYAELAPDLTASVVLRGAGGTVEQVRQDLAASGRFASVRTAVHPWTVSYSAADYVALLGTHSDHLRLGAQRLAAVGDRVGALVEDAGGTATVRYRTEAVLGRTAEAARTVAP